MEEQNTPTKTQNSLYSTTILLGVLVVAGWSVPYPLTCLNPMVPIIQKIYNQTHVYRNGEPMPEDEWTLLLSFTMSAVFIGALIGSLSVKLWLSRFTKRMTLAITNGINIFGHVIIAVGVSTWGSYEACIIGRVITGIAMGMGLGIYGMYINEISVPHRRPLFAGLLGTWYVLGGVLAILLGWPKVFGNEEHWILVIIFGMLFSIIFIAAVYWIPDTPAEIMQREGSEEALKILKRLRTNHSPELEVEMKALTGESGTSNNEDKNDNPAKETSANLLEILKTPQHRNQFFAVVIVFANLTVSGVSNILFFSDVIFLDVGLDPEIVTVGTIAVELVGVFSSFGAIFAMKRVDPKHLFLIGTAISLVGDVLMTASMATYEDFPVMSVISVIATGIYFFGFCVFNMTAYVIITAITVDRTRAICFTTAMTIFWFFAWFTGFISPYFNIWLGPYAFLIWMTLSLLIGVYVLFRVPTISGKTEAEIQEFFKPRIQKLRS